MLFNTLCQQKLDVCAMLHDYFCKFDIDKILTSIGYFKSNPTYKHISFEKDEILANHNNNSVMSSMTITLNNKSEYNLICIGYLNFTKFHVNNGT